MFSPKCGIYAITSPSGKRYIGQSARLGQRWSEHKSKLKYGTHPCKALQSAFHKYGVDGLHFEVLVNCARDQLGHLETELANELRPEYNSGNYGPSPCLGLKYSEEVRKNMSRGQTGLKRGNYSAEHRKAISDAKKGTARPDVRKHDKPVRCIETGIWYAYPYAAEQALGKRGVSILRVCQGKQKMAYGFHWEF